MNNPFLLTEIPQTDSPLYKLAKSYDELPDRMLNKSIDMGTQGLLPRSGGSWSGEAGNSKWIPDKEYEPANRSHSNETNKTWGTILDEQKIDGIPFSNGEPDFSEVSKGTVEIDNFSDERYGAGGNFDQADEKLAQQRGCTKEEVREWRKEHNYTWHERSDCKTMDKVPREVHGNIAHSGGISTIKNRDSYGR